MAHDTEWFEALTVVEAKDERIIFGLSVCRVVILLVILCVVANAAWNGG